jgi:hypothetical protein
MVGEGMGAGRRSEDPNRGGPVDFGVQELKNAPKDESWNPFDILLP